MWGIKFDPRRVTRSEPSQAQGQLHVLSVIDRRCWPAACAPPGVSSESASVGVVMVSLAEARAYAVSTRGTGLPCKLEFDSCTSFISFPGATIARIYNKITNCCEKAT